MKKSKKIVIASLGLCAALGVTGIFAYFTDTDKASNLFQIGHLEIELQEPSWDPDNPPTDIVPNAEFEKDPQIENTGNVPAYMFAKVSVPKDTFILAQEDGTRTETTASLHEVFVTKYGDGSYGDITKGYNTNDWVLLSDYTDTSSSDLYNYYIFAYKDAVKSGDKTSAIFSKVKFVNAVEGYVDNKTYTIDVNAEGIQSDSLPESVTAQTDNQTKLAKAYEIYLNQNK